MAEASGQPQKKARTGLPRHCGKFVPHMAVYTVTKELPSKTALGMIQIFATPPACLPRRTFKQWHDTVARMNQIQFGMSVTFTKEVQIKNEETGDPMKALQEDYLHAAEQGSMPDPRGQTTWTRDVDIDKFLEKAMFETAIKWSRRSRHCLCKDLSRHPDGRCTACNRFSDSTCLHMAAGGEHREFCSCAPLPLLFCFMGADAAGGNIVVACTVFSRLCYVSK